MTPKYKKEKKALKDQIAKLEKNYDEAIDKYNEKLFILNQIADIFKRPQEVLTAYSLYRGSALGSVTPSHNQLTAWVSDMVSENELFAKRTEDLERQHNHLLRILAKDPTLKPEMIKVGRKNGPV
jgi:hypothetical protein